MAEFQDLPEETQEGIVRGIEDIEAGRHKVIHVEEPKLPTLSDARFAYIDRECFVAFVKGIEPKTDEEYGEEFDELIESIRAKAWLEGHSFRSRVNPYKASSPSQGEQ